MLDWNIVYRYLENENINLNDYERVELFFGKTLEEAWIKARPNDEYKFENKDFKQMVNRCNGKWLEKQNEKDTYKIIIAYEGLSKEEITGTYIHELTHIIDYQNAVKDKPFEEQHCGNRLFTKWSEFNAEYARAKLMYLFNKEKGLLDDFTFASSYLGYKTADALHGIMNNSDEDAVLYYIVRYLGVQLAIKDIAEEELLTDVFELFYMTPTHITAMFGDVYLLAREFQYMKECSLDEENDGRCYEDVLLSVKEYVSK